MKKLHLTINENVVKQLKDLELEKMSNKEIPYENIEIITPNFFTTFDLMIESRPEIKNDPKEIAYLKFFMSLPYKIEVKKLDKNKSSISMTIISPKKNVKNIEFTASITQNTVYEVHDLVSTETGEGYDLATVILEFVGKILNHLDKPTTIKEIHRTKEPKRPTKKRKQNKKNNVQYVYKTVYKITNIQSEKKTTRRSSSEREWNKEEWTRRGHYRIYRDKETGEIKKKVWIDKTVCHAHGKIKKNQHYKITRID